MKSYEKLKMEFLVMKSELSGIENEIQNFNFVGYVQQ